MQLNAIAGPMSLPHLGALTAHGRDEAGVDQGSVKRTVNGLLEAMKLVRKQEQAELLTPQAIQITLIVALEPGITTQTLETRTGLSLASISRNLAALGKWHRLGRPGLDYVERVEDPQERRRTLMFLTKKGEEFVNDLVFAQTGERGYIETTSAKDYLNRAHRGR